MVEFVVEFMIIAPPTFTLPPIPAPPVTRSAPVAVVVDAVVFVLVICPVVEITIPEARLLAVIVPDTNLFPYSVPSTIDTPVSELPAKDVVPDTINFPDTTFPPTNAFPAIPAPPVTWSAPVAVVVDAVVLVMDVLGVVTVPVKFGDASGALRSNAVC